MLVITNSIFKIKPACQFHWAARAEKSIPMQSELYGIGRCVNKHDR